MCPRGAGLCVPGPAVSEAPRERAGRAGGGPAATAAGPAGRRRPAGGGCAPAASARARPGCPSVTRRRAGLFITCRGKNPTTDLGSPPAAPALSHRGPGRRQPLPESPPSCPPCLLRGRQRAAPRPPRRGRGPRPVTGRRLAAGGSAAPSCPAPPLPPELPGRAPAMRPGHTGRPSRRAPLSMALPPALPPPPPRR